MLAVAVLLALACSEAEAPPPEPVSYPSVILAVFDTTRFDDWSIFEPTRGVTPVLDTLAAQGVRFTNARSLHTATVPSHVTLFTGHAVLSRRARTTSALGEPRFGYRPSSLFTILGAKGFRTYAFSGNKNVNADTIEALATVDVTDGELHEHMPEERLRSILSAYGEWVDDVESLPEVERDAYLRHQRVIRGSAENVNHAALVHMRAHAEAHPEAPYFLFLNYNDAHDPYFPEPPWDARFRSPDASDFNGNIWSHAQRRERVPLSPIRLNRTSRGLSPGDLVRARDLHLGELAYADAQFGSLLESLRKLGLLDEVVIVAVSDHGELFGEHGRMSHSGSGVEELLHIPLVLRFPDGAFPPATIDAQVDMRDVKPTLLDFLGIEDDSSRGRSLLPLLRGEPIPEAVPRPDRDEPRADGESLIEGQDAETTRRLREQLKELGYIE